MEIWKDVKGYENLYQVSNLGRVKSLKRKHKYNNRFQDCQRELKESIMTPRVNFGYEDIKLYKNGKRKGFKVHRLITEAFIPNPENKPQVNHINGIKNDNNLSNLEWASREENMQHAWDNKLLKSSSKQRNAARKSGLKNGRLVLDTATGIFYSSANEACKCTGVTPSGIHGKLSGKANNNTNLIYA